jgi:hypothetical protein
MKVLFTISFILTVAIGAAAQPEGWVEVPSRLIVGDRSGNAPPMPDYDVAREAVAGFRMGSDCYMRVAGKVFRVESEKKYRVILNNIYGGCRAGGWRSGFVIFRKPQIDYLVEVTELDVDRVHSSPGGGFEFPKPPSEKTHEPLDVREIDLSGCLELAGQSQWIIRDAQTLDKSIIDGFETEACREHIADLAINFDATTLVGWSFASGYCERPSGLVFSAVKETTSSPAENRFVINADYDPPGQSVCKDWRTYPVWLLIPQLPEGLRIDFTENGK